MGWVSKRELRRLQRELDRAVKRADAAERRLNVERQSKDWTILQLTSRFVTKQGGYALDAEKPELPPPDPRRFTHEPTAEDLAKREWYIRCYAERGWLEDDAVQLWEAEMRGEQVRYPYEDDAELSN